MKFVLIEVNYKKKNIRYVSKDGSLKVNRSLGDHPYYEKDICMMLDIDLATDFKLFDNRDELHDYQLDALEEDGAQFYAFKFDGRMLLSHDNETQDINKVVIHTGEALYAFKQLRKPVVEDKPKQYGIRIWERGMWMYVISHECMRIHHLVRLTSRPKSDWYHCTQYNSPEEAQQWIDDTNATVARLKQQPDYHPIQTWWIETIVLATAEVFELED